MRYSLFGLLELACGKISIIALLFMALITFIDVFGRVVFNSPLGVAYELVGILLAICFYSGLYHVHKKKKHIRIDLFDSFLSGKLGVITTWFSYLLEVVFFGALVTMVYYQVEETKMFGEVFMFLQFEKWKVLAVVFVLSVIALISLLESYPDRKSAVDND